MSSLINGKKARKELKKQHMAARKGGYPTSFCSYAISYEDSSKNIYRVDAGCFGGLLVRKKRNIIPLADIETIDCFVSLVVPPRAQNSYGGQRPLSARKRNTWLSWVLRSSPWRSAFHTKNVATAVMEGILCDVSVPSNLLIGGLMAVRAVTDNTTKVIVWNDLVEHGLDPLYAYLASHFFEPSENPTVNGYDLKFRGQIYPSAEHMALGDHFFRDESVMYNFLNEKVIHPRPAFKKDTLFTTDGRSIHQTWGKGGGRKTWMLDVPSFKPTKEKGSGWMTSYNGRNSARSAGMGGDSVNIYSTEKEKEKLIDSITKQFNKIKKGKE